jgi:RNA polymerase sigma-70 factor (ECF subfamily)
MRAALTAHEGSLRELTEGMAEPLQNSAALARQLAPMIVRTDDRDRRARSDVTPEQVFALVYRQMRVLAGHRDVDELAQAAAEQAIRAIPSFAGRSRLSTWTFRICYLTVRKHDRWYRRWLRRFTLTDDGELPERASDARALDERLIDDERVARVRAALHELSPRRRAVIILHDLEGLSIDQIADIVGARTLAVRSRLRDGRKMLAKILADDPYFGVEACGPEKESR